MANRETNQAANVAFSATVASALARSIRDTPLRPQALPTQAEALVAAAQIVIVPADDAKETV